MAKGLSQVLRVESGMEGGLVLSQPKRLRHLLGVEIFLEARKGHPDFLRLAEVGDGVLNRAVFESEQRCQLLLIEFLDTLGDVVLKNKIKKHLLLGAEAGVDIDPCIGGADFAGEGGFGVGDMGQ